MDTRSSSIHYILSLSLPTFSFYMFQDTRLILINGRVINDNARTIVQELYCMQRDDDKNTMKWLNGGLFINTNN